MGWDVADAVLNLRSMRVRSFEISGVVDGDLRKLHDYLLETGGFEFRAGGSGFFVVVGERFVAASAASFAQMVLASREDGIINLDIVIAGGGDNPDGRQADVLRATELVRGFVERHELTIADI